MSISNKVVFALSAAALLFATTAATAQPRAPQPRRTSPSGTGPGPAAPVMNAPQQAGPSNMAGVYLGYETETEWLQVGGEARFNIGVENLQIAPALTYYIVDDVPDGVDILLLQIDANALYYFPLGGVVTPYAGGGLGILYSSTSFDSDAFEDTSDTSVGVNLLGGAVFNIGSAIKPFAELQVTIEDDEIFALQGGVLFEF